jgi:uncharacterized protein (UPF0303 family)
MFWFHETRPTWECNQWYFEHAFNYVLLINTAEERISNDDYLKKKTHLVDLLNPSSWQQRLALCDEKTEFK